MRNRKIIINALFILLLVINLYNIFLNGDMTFRTGGLYFVFSIFCLMIQFPMMIIFLIKTFNKLKNK